MTFATRRKGKLAAAALFALSLSGCMSFYERNMAFNSHFVKGDYAEAVSYIEGQKRLKKSNVKVLYDLNHGTASFMMDSTKQSIEHFAAADLYVEDFSKNYAYEALALVSNPNVKPYELEYHERVLIHFFQALNYIKLPDYEGAMVECRRMNLALTRLNDSFKRHDGKRYSRDAFGHYLMGILYETMGDHNNAFIAYRNAYDIYSTDYAELFGITEPQGLQAALLRSASSTGLTQEVRKYEKLFNIKYAKATNGKGRLVAFVMEGLSPIKSERSFEFVRAGHSGIVNYTSKDGGLSVPIFIGDCSPNEASSLKDFSYVRLTLPQYVQRQGDALRSVAIDGQSVKAETAEDIAKIAPQSLKDRMWAEVGKAILRMATKEAMHQAVKKQNEYAGLFLSIATAVTEQADTRCWLSLPARIKVIDMELTPGSHSLTINTKLSSGQQTIDITEGKTTFTVIDAL